MRRITGLWFGGNGANSQLAASFLHDLLEDALSNLSGLQQGVTGQDRIDGEQEIEDVVRDIAAALLGRNIEIKDELPYPGEWKL